MDSMLSSKSIFEQQQQRFLNHFASIFFLQLFQIEIAAENALKSKYINIQAIYSIHI